MRLRNLLRKKPGNIDAWGKEIINSKKPYLPIVNIYFDEEVIQEDENRWVILRGKVKYDVGSDQRIFEKEVNLSFDEKPDKDAITSKLKEAISSDLKILKERGWQIAASFRMKLKYKSLDLAA